MWGRPGVMSSYCIWVGKKELLMGKEWHFCRGLQRNSPGVTLQGGLLGVGHSTYTRIGLTDACAQTEKENEKKKGEIEKKEHQHASNKKKRNKEK